MRVFFVYKIKVFSKLRYLLIDFLFQTGFDKEQNWKQKGEKSNFYHLLTTVKAVLKQMKVKDYKIEEIETEINQTNEVLTSEFDLPLSSIIKLNNDELLEKIREIRASEKRFYQKVKEQLNSLFVDYYQGYFIDTPSDW